jgi:hypothetical protein
MIDSAFFKTFLTVAGSAVSTVRANYRCRLSLIMVYRVFESAGIVEIVNVIHGAQLWPPAR